MIRKREELKRISEAYNQVITELSDDEKSKIRSRISAARKTVQRYNKEAAKRDDPKSKKKWTEKADAARARLKQYIAQLHEEEGLDEFFVGVRDEHMKGMERDLERSRARKDMKKMKERKAQKEKDDVKAKAKAKKHGKATRAKAREKSSGMTAEQLNKAIENAKKRIKVKSKQVKTEKNEKIKKGIQQAIARDKHKITAWRGLLRKAS